jgi:trehalose/maltose hydrolase-like predicted phosphorylase
MSESTDWKIVYNEYEPDHQHLREALCTLGNGYFASRGAFSSAPVSHHFEDNPHYPATYLAGAFNSLKSKISGEVIENESIVNWPNWMYLTFEQDDGLLFSMDDVEIEEFKQSLDLKLGQLEVALSFQDKLGRKSRLRSCRVISMEDPHLGAIEWELTPLNWSGTIEIISALEGNVLNRGVPRYSDLNSHHVDVIEQGRFGEDCLYMYSRTNHSGKSVCQAIRTRVFYGNQPYTISRKVEEEENYIANRIRLEVSEHQSVTVSKSVAVYSSRDNGIGNLVEDATRKVSQAPEIAEIFERHHMAWRSLWTHSDIRVRSQNNVQVLLRLHIFHLLQVASPNTIDMDVSVPSRGLHGEAYRGNIMWDELFIFPVINYIQPSITRNMLKYRFHRLDEARRLAAQQGYRGAMFPWQSGSNGEENAQEIHLNPQSGRWIEDHTDLQRHVNAAIAFNIWRYYQISNDHIFLEEYGAEMMLSITLFWSSKATYDEKKQRYVIERVVGPDEFHTSYPGSDEPGLNNNAYTNILVAWVMQQSIQMYELLPGHLRNRLSDKLGIRKKDLDKWKAMSEGIFVPMINKDIIEQYEGYDQLEEFDWEGYRKKYKDLQRLDRILEKEDDTPNRYKASKQADVLMLFYLFTSEELEQIMGKLGYSFSGKMIEKNINYYEQRTSHGSTLSRMVYSWVTTRANREKSWDFFKEALKSDFEDIQGGTTSEGIHLGAMAGTVDIVQRAYTGVYVDDDILWLNPTLPDEMEEIHLGIRFRGQCLSLKINKDQLQVVLADGWGDQIRVGISSEGKAHVLKPGKTLLLDCSK